MNSSHFRQKLKPWMLPIAMVVGLLLNEKIERVAFIATALIFAMLLITYCKVDPRHLRVCRMTWILLAIQIFGAIALCAIIYPFSPIVAQGALICVFCPTATAAPVICGMLGGSIPTLATFQMLSNLAVAILAPLMLSFFQVGDAGISVVTGFLTIGTKVVPLILGPLLVALLLMRFTPRLHRELASRQGLSFYLWAFSLVIVVGRAVAFVIKEPAEAIGTMLALAAVALVACCVQFYLGRLIGDRYGDKVAGGQGLGQKNTVLAIWMCLTWLNPIVSVAPAAYILWQNTINSAQIWAHERNKTS